MTPEQSTNSHLLQKMQQLEAERDALQKRVDDALAITTDANAIKILTGEGES